MRASTLYAIATFFEQHAIDLTHASEVCDPAIAANMREKVKTYRAWSTELRAESHEAQARERAMRKPAPSLQVIQGGAT